MAKTDFPHAFIQNVEHSKSSSAVQGIAHEVQCPDGVRVWEHNEGLRRSGEQPRLGAPRQIQPQLAIDAPHPFIVPAMSGAPRPVHVCPEPPAGSGGAQGGQGLNHWRISPGPAHDGPVVRGSP
jgi:hypothetical protein